MKQSKAAIFVLLAGALGGSMGLFVRRLNAAGLYAMDVVMDLDVPLPPDESVHCADGRKNSGGNEPNQNPNDDKNGKISALLPDTE